MIWLFDCAFSLVYDILRFLALFSQYKHDESSLELFGGIKDDQRNNTSNLLTALNPEGKEFFSCHFLPNEKEYF